MTNALAIELAINGAMFVLGFIASYARTPSFTARLVFFITTYIVGVARGATL